MNITINKPLRGGTIKSIASKSQAHRLLICAALSDGDTYVRCAESSDDIDATAACLEALGAEIERDENGFTVSSVKRTLTGSIIKLDCRESGSTLRFLIPVCCALGVNAEIHMSGRLPSRPLSPMLEELLSHGCKITGAGKSPLHCAGKLQNGEYKLPGNISSQFISGLLLALPLTDGGSEIHVTGREESKPYIDMTLDALRMFNIEIDSRGAFYGVKGAQSYKTPGTVNVEGDWSNAAFWLCAGAIGKQSVTVTGLNLKSSQGDMAVVKILERFGAEVRYGADSVTVTPQPLHGIRIDAGDTPDLVPVISAVAAAAQGETVIYNAERLRIKESDRLHAVTRTLTVLGADIIETEDGLIIKGGKTLDGGTVDSFGDHRIAMTAAIAAIICKNPVTINNAEAVNKSYPGFFSDYAALGGEVL